MGDLNFWQCRQGYVHKSDSNKRPVRQVEIGCMATAEGYNETRGHEWRLTSNDKALEPCVEGKLIPHAILS